MSVSLTYIHMSIAKKEAAGTACKLRQGNRRLIFISHKFGGKHYTDIADTIIIKIGLGYQLNRISFALSYLPPLWNLIMVDVAVQVRFLLSLPRTMKLKIKMSLWHWQHLANKRIIPKVFLFIFLNHCLVKYYFNLSSIK